MSAISRCRGTPIEPFRLAEDEMRAAVALARVAFSSTQKQTHFRIVGRDTIGNSGGCVLTDKLDHYYVERFALGRIREAPGNTWMFAPSEEPSLIFSTQPVPKAKCHFRGKGLTFTVSGVACSTLRWNREPPGRPDAYPPIPSHLDRDLALHSRIGEANFASFGINPVLKDQSLSFSIDTPEALMRLAAHLADGSVIRLDPGPEYPCRKILIYRLPDLEDSAAAKGCIMIAGCYANGWLHFPARDAPKLKSAQMVAISRWAAFHESWERQIISEILT